MDQATINVIIKVLEKIKSNYERAGVYSGADYISMVIQTIKELV